MFSTRTRIRNVLLRTLNFVSVALAARPTRSIKANEPSPEYVLPREIVNYPSPHTKAQRAKDRVQPVKAYSKGRKKTWGRQ